MPKPPKIYTPDAMARARKLIPVVVVLLLAAIIMQVRIDPLAKEYHKGERGLADTGGGLNNEFLLLPMLGFREAAAGLLWVRADEFFHSGDYDAILPLVRLITWLDPHADTVYVTGAWHLAYNFTDSAERSDRRYIAPSQALLEEGINNNMNIPDIKFEKAWQNYDKIKNYIEAAKYFQMAIDGPDKKHPGRLNIGDDAPFAAPLKTLHMLAHTYEKQGRIPEALDEWHKAKERSDEMLKARPGDHGILQLQEAEVRNAREMLQRYRNRYAESGHDPVNPTPYPAILMPAAGKTTPSTWDVAFQPNIEIKRPKVLRIYGRFNAADGARIGVRITDWDYQEKPIVGVINRFDVDQSQTILVESIAVKKDKFERELDMSQDPKMYSFSEPTYRIILYYDPRSTAPHLQDRFGWSGEGLTDSNPNHIRLDQREQLLGTKLVEGQGGQGPQWDGATVPWPQHGQPPRLIMVTYKVTREQLMGQKPITDKDIIPNGPDVMLNE